MGSRLFLSSSVAPEIISSTYGRVAPLPSNCPTCADGALNVYPDSTNPNLVSSEQKAIGSFTCENMCICATDGRCYTRNNEMTSAVFYPYCADGVCSTYVIINGAADTDGFTATDGSGTMFTVGQQFPDPTTTTRYPLCSSTMVSRHVQFHLVSLLLISCNAQLFNLGQLGHQLGQTMDQLGHALNPQHNQQGHQHQPGGNLAADLNNFGQQLNQQVGTLLGDFFAPQPNSGIPPHVLRRIMRFCARHPDHQKCRNRFLPEYRAQGGAPPPPPKIGIPIVDDMFPGLTQFQIPPIPHLNLPDVLAGVPDLLRSLIPPMILGQLDELARRSVLTTCQITRTCKQQKREWLIQRANIAEQEAAVQKVLNPGKPQEQTDREIELRLARTQQVKEALLKQAGLAGQVEANNDGTFQHDILLTEAQSNALLNQIGKPSNGRRKRSSLFLEMTPSQTWPANQPIPYTFDQSMTHTDQETVHNAIREIQSKTCVRFSYTPTKPNTPHLYYVKAPSPTYCGLSYIGRVEPANPIYLSFMCGTDWGVAIHETLHALGLNHEQLRGDRDQFLTINWDNINPQNYDFFAIADSKQFTSYGVPYDYGSIMHYNAYIASQYPSKPSMTPKFNTQANMRLMGQRNGLSARDVEIVTKMYCMPGCVDRNVYCGAWALKDLCNRPAQKGWMLQNCQKSCGFCR